MSTSKNNLQDGGKFADDFRISSAGRLMRMFWLDEVPMIFNMLKGDLKLVGVRPLSNQYYDLYDEDLRQQRILLQTRTGAAVLRRHAPHPCGDPAIRTPVSPSL